MDRKKVVEGKRGGRRRLEKCLRRGREIRRKKIRRKNENKVEKKRME